MHRICIFSRIRICIFSRIRIFSLASASASASSFHASASHFGFFTQSHPHPHFGFFHAITSASPPWFFFFSHIRIRIFHACASASPSPLTPLSILHSKLTSAIWHFKATASESQTSTPFYSSLVDGCSCFQPSDCTLSIFMAFHVLH
ncbi:hypothetical protein BDP27DRAFT_250363 [Rhodocollybia butyracea]|uniref:Uncharacterized protein n=1 Tax=Rhodocollybia butyracea TaxID=206335 RepID=A0A9P5PFZ8_9AGAR|nr:hypothetical protein BDP27DRAFT_250363 [Rhodocollybia butyracea]